MSARRSLRGALLLVLACMAGMVRAGDGADFAAFLRTWRAAVERNDAAAVAAMAHTPFLFEGRGHDPAGVAKTVVPALLTPPVRRCLVVAPPVEEDGRYVLDCTPYLFYLERIDGRWRWVEFAADGEG